MVRKPEMDTRIPREMPGASVSGVSLDGIASGLSSSSSDNRALLATPTKAAGSKPVPIEDACNEGSYEFPCLSFARKHDSEFAGNFVGNRQQAESHAIHLLQRPIRSPSPSTTIQENFITSFGTLVESRVHAYIKHFGNSRSQSLLSLAARMITKVAVTRFEVCSKRNSQHACVCFVAALDVSIPSSDSRDDTLVSVAMSTYGSIKVVDEITQVHLNISVLLPEMIRQASKIAKALVEATARPLPRLPSGSSIKNIMSMPPPPPRPSKTAGLDLLGEAAASLAVVSPDMSGQKRPLSSIPTLDLNDDSNNQVDGLSLDQCVDIVDSCLTGFAKRSRTDRPRDSSTTTTTTTTTTI